MRTWVLIAALAAVCLAAERELSNKERVRETLRSWDPAVETQYFEPIRQQAYRTIDESDIFLDTHHISKRSIAQPQVLAGMATRGCNMPGYTGETCQYPLCTARNPYVPNDASSDDISIDATNLANCTQQYIIVVDETMWDIKIELETESPLNPRFFLQAENGNIIAPDSDSQRGTAYTAKYGFLPPGQYLLGPLADTAVEFCTMMMTARTNIQVSGGFTSGNQPELSDYPTLKFAYFDTESSIVLHAQGLNFPGQVQAVGWTGSENHISRYVPIGVRFNCTYPYILERYTCRRTSNNDVGHNFMQVEGMSNSGYLFRRILPYQCILPPATTSPVIPTTPTPAPITSCQNGGQLLKDANGNNYCYCFGLFTGSTCSQMLCANGGFLPTPTSDRCECPEGFTGFNCENIVCTDTSGFDFNAENPTLTLVIRSRTQLSSVIEQSTDAVQQIVDLLATEPGYLTNFIVVLFDNGRLLVNKRYDSWDAAMVDLLKAIHSAPSDGGCDDVVFSAIASALSLYPTNKSPIYVITDANPNDSTEKETVFNLESYWRAPIYFLYVQPGPSDGCNTSPDNSGYRDMMDMAARSSGNTFYFSNRTSVSTFFYQHMLNTLFRSQLVLSGDYSHCTNQNVYKSASIDLSTDLVVVVATGTDLTLLVTNPFMDRVTFDSSFSDGVNYIWTYNRQVSGQWFFNLISTSPNSACTFKVYQKKFNFGGQSQYNPDYDIFWSFATTLTSAGALRQPVLGFDASPVFHVSNYPQFVSMDRVHANLQIYAIRDGVQTEVYGSSGMWRDACEFNFYFPPFTCRVPEETLYFNFFARDSKDMTIQRAGTMYCATIHPTPPPDHQCQNGGVMNPSNTTCFCTPEFTGTYCQNVVCYNGGTASGDHCVCPPGYAGVSCELPRCVETGPSPEFIRYGVDMVFAVEITQNSLASLVMLDTNFQEILRDVLMQDRGWIRNFVLVGFNSTWGGPIAVSPANDLSAITTALHTLASQVPSDTGCSVKLWDALNHAVFERDIAPGSYIEIFQTTPENVSDSDLESWRLFYQMTRSMDLVAFGFLASNPRFQPEGFVCNATVQDYFTLFDIASGSAGTTYTLQAAEISNAVRIIPLQFSSGQVTFFAGLDCRHDDGLITYFPVDAYTQTIQIQTFGYNQNIQVYNGNGVLAEALQLFADDFTGQAVYEIRKPCDDGWEPFGQYCVKFVVKSAEILPMPQARNFCASAGGYLVDDLGEDKNNFLYTASANTQFWTGLFRNTDGQFYWDRGQGISPDLLNQAKTFWADNEPSADPTNQCVFYNGRSSDMNKVWTTDSCSTPRGFLCQKHRYDLDHRPNVIGDDDLPAGNWYLKLKVAPSAGYPTICTASVRVQSSLQVVTGYSTSIGNDFPQPDPIQDSNANRLITYVHSVDNENRVPILTDAILWDAYNGTFYNGLKYQPRFGCQYGWVSQDFPCPNGDNDANEFGVLHVGEDEFGNTFQRLTYGHCSKAEITCGNGGIRKGGQCVCNDYWTGMYCTVPICVNGGNRTADERSCDCPDGYGGPNCQFEVCQPNIPQLFSNDRKTLLMVVETTRQNSDTVNQLIANLKNIVTSATNFAPLWFSNFGLVTFDTTGRTFEKFDYASIDDLITDLTTQSNNIATDGACSMPFLGVLGHLLEHDDVIAIPNSEIFLVTAAGPSDLNQYGNTMDTLFNTQAHLHYIVSKSPSCPTFDGVNNVRDMTWLGYGSSGNILFTDASNIVNLFNNYLPSLYGASVLQDPTGNQNYTCSDGSLPWFVPVDINTTFIYVTTSSEFGTLSITDPLGQGHNVAPAYNVNDQKIYKIEVDRIAGIWKLLLVNPPGLCLAHVYSTGGAKVYTKFSMPNPIGGKADPLGSHQDGRMVQPTAGFDNVAVFHLAGNPFHKGQLQYVEIFDIGQNSVTNVLRSELYVREGCSYEYYSDLFTCNGDMIAVFVHGVDEANQKFRRQEIVVCNGRAPTTGQPVTGSPVTGTMAPVTTTKPPVTQQTQQPPQTVQTQGPVSSTSATPHTAYQFDIVFLIDGSQSAQSSFDSFTKFVQTMMIPFNVGVAGARVGLVVVAPDLDDQAPPAANLNSITSQQVLISYLNQLKNNYADFDHPGQVLTYNLQVVTSTDFMAAGYRSTINNHVLVYITTTTSFYTDPTPSAQTILANKQYGIITIGYGASVDPAKLQTISGGSACSFTATDVATLNNQIKPIQQLIMNASDNGGVYCTGN